MKDGLLQAASVRIHLPAALGLTDGDSPFPWQYTLLDRLCAEDPPRALDIPTGLGKTATIAIWLLARAAGADVPRRLVYVVDRRAVVDQATEVAQSLYTWVSQNREVADALDLDGRPLAISTLRGQTTDNREWLEDPTMPAIIVGTVDMVGSRLLFEGYGTSRKMRPYYAGLLGSDCLYVLDESHLVPPFEALIGALARFHDIHGAPASVPRCWLMSLSATGGHSERIDHGIGDSDGGAGRLLRLTDEDREKDAVRERLYAKKRITLQDVNPKDKPMVNAMVDEAWQLVDGRPRRCVIFVNARTDAEKVEAELRKRLRREPEHGRGTVELLVGGRRVFEREQAKKKLSDMGFLAGSNQPQKPAFLVATSAGEVGVDLDADDMVADLVAWECTGPA